IWNTGETTQNITVNAPGAYQVTISDDTGCKAISETVTVVREVAINTNVVATNGLDLFPCQGDTLELCALNAFDEVNWSTDNQMQCLQVTSTGQYFASISNACSTQQTDTFDIQFVQYPTPLVVSEEYDENTGQLELTSSQNNTTWYRDANGDEVLGQGAELGLSDVFNDTTVFLQAEGLVTGDTLTGGKLDYEGPGGQNIPGFPGVLTFDVFKPFTLKSVDVQCFEASNPILLIQNRSQETLLLEEVSLNEGINTISIDFVLEEGTNYSLRFVGEDPKSFINRGNVNYPYPIGDGHGEVTSGGFTDSEYFYFYNWQLVPFEKDCQSAYVAHTFEISSSYEADPGADLMLYPNPTGGMLYLDLKSAQSAEIKVFNRLGQVVLNNAYDTVNGRIMLDVSALNQGLYYLQLVDPKGGMTAIKSFVRAE
ncbi:MAG TPA: T9SS type A sorting domain-containing protein, partial [Saprospiraceae bacterium]|nr:T9SS type A sorting domain-containing protein [Saprospiraceae bacterium]